MIRIVRASLAGALLWAVLASPPAAAVVPTVVGIATTPSGAGHWLVDDSGRVTTDGDAIGYGSLAGQALQRPVVGIASTRTGRGYWLVASDGGVFTFGDARFLGSTGAMALNQPIVGMARSADGYWLVARDGGVFTFGDAKFLGSTGAMALNQPIVAMAPTPNADGYWLVARDGGVFTFGDAKFLGSAGAMALNQPIVGMAPTPNADGYWLVARDGGVFTFGDAKFLGAGGADTTAVAGGGGYALATGDGRVAAFSPSGSTATAAPVPFAPTSTTTTTTTPPPATGGGSPVAPPPPISPPTDPTTTTTTATPAAPAPTLRDARMWPFSSDSPWNMPIGSGARYESAADARTATLIDPAKSTAWANAEEYSHPIYFAAATDPLVILRRAGFADVTFRMPAGATPAAGADRHLHVVDPSGRWLDESWNTQGVAPNLTTGYHVLTDLYGPGVGAGGVRAYGGSAVGGLLRTWELNAGAIHHAAAIGITGDQLGAGPVWPATAQDGDAATYRGNVPMGTLAAIPPSVDVTALGLTPTGLAVAHALQDYGAYVVDRAGCFCLYAEQASGGTTPVTDLRHDAARLRSLLRVVTNNSAGNRGGGGTRRAPLAPPLP